MVATAVGILAAGGPERLALIERPVREPRAGEVRIAVAAAAVDPTDLLLRQHGVAELPPPWTPGMEGSGVIERVGAGVARLEPGEAVIFALNPRRAEGGAQAELVVVPAAAVVPAPAGLSLAAAAALPMNGLTARLALEAAAVPAGGTVAVSGGAGVVASLAIALAKGRGLRVLAETAAADQPLARAVGADHLVPRGELAGGVREIVAAGADAVIDTALLFDGALGAVRDGGRLVVLRDWPGQPPSRRRIAIERVRVSRFLERTDWLAELAAAASRGVLRPRVAAELAPAAAAEAHRAIAAGGVRGRFVIAF